MSVDGFDDMTIEDPWERLEHTAPVVEIVAEEEDVEALQRYRRLIESIEQRVTPGGTADEQ